MWFENVRLGYRYRDIVTNASGICTVKAEYLQDENRVKLEGSDKAGRPMEFWVPVRRLEGKKEE